jgi:hypothetical protein
VREELPLRDGGVLHFDSPHNPKRSLPEPANGKFCQGNSRLKVSG